VAPPTLHNRENGGSGTMPLHTPYPA